MQQLRGRRHRALLGNGQGVLELTKTHRLPSSRQSLSQGATRLRRRRFPFLAPFGSRYGPLDTTLMRRQPDRILHSNHGVFRQWTRFCPRCLAGGSNIERAHGGSWKRLWRLPPVFSCLTHRCLLRHNCFKCSHLGLEVQGLSFIPRVKDEELHPNRCRTVIDGSPDSLSSPICGTRHDQGPPPTCSETFLDTALALQGELLIALDPDSPREVRCVGWMIDTSQYFMDLHTIAGLITLTWPAARDLARSDEHAGILEHDVQLREERRNRLHAMRGKFHYLHVLVSPAPDARAYVAATVIAHQILKGTDLQALEALAPIHAHLQEVQGPVKAEGDRMRNSPKNSPPLRALLTRRAPVTITAINQYPKARDREWRPSPVRLFEIDDIKTTV
ncbi:TniQ family protein [Streptomyces alanosinicus]|uniref:TniQ domain-containing protein n=1 Tax=Streptomyces alanosinicus TaxID=68171 RepID=A0A919D243_9ACTN|nr:TniQ family protein [Streptomyces alanosinicus]GHE00023.1 hypothetical protein GCM10010339_13330 [Streptomyces alanosinicus]